VDSLEATRNLLGYLGAVEDGESRGNDPMFHGKNYHVSWENPL
jgi:hypothetical protein